MSQLLVIMYRSQDWRHSGNHVEIWLQISRHLTLLEYLEICKYSLHCIGEYSRLRISHI